MRVRAGVAVALWIALTGAPNAAAATFTVTRTDDPAPDGCMPMDCSLREAILDANSSAGGDTISLPEGHFRLTIPGAGEDAAMTGDLDLTDGVQITGSGARATVVDATGSDRVFDVGNEISARIAGVTITGGLVAGDGGGIRNQGSLGLAQDAIVGNRAQGSGGGVADAGGTGILQSLVARNEATDGGGIYVLGMTNVETSTVSDNVAGGPGTTGHGGGAAGSGDSNLVLQSSTVTDNLAFNAALSGGGIDTPSAHAFNTILASNRAYAVDQATSALANCAAPLDSGGHNLSDGGDCGLVQPGDHEEVPPLLGPLADNGGPTDTEALLPGSPALDAGFECDVYDQRGVWRLRADACDIGAYEYAPPLVTTVAASAVAFSTATLNGTVDPSYRETTAYFEYGRTTAYGSKTPVRIVGSGNGQMSFTEPLAGLRQGATYHFRLVAENAEGVALGTDQTFTTSDRTKPVLTLLRVGPGLFHRKNGATFSFTLSEDATVTFRFDHVLRGVRRGKRCVKITRHNRRRRPCARYLPVSGSVVQQGAEGPNSIHFDARVGTKLLTFGAYRLRATPRDAAANVGKTALAAFRVLR
jgi:hypothetical protein